MPIAYIKERMILRSTNNPVIIIDYILNMMCFKNQENKKGKQQQKRIEFCRGTILTQKSK